MRRFLRQWGNRRSQTCRRQRRPGRPARRCSTRSESTRYPTIGNRCRGVPVACRRRRARASWSSRSPTSRSPARYARAQTRLSLFISAIFFSLDLTRGTYSRTLFLFLFYKKLLILIF